MKIFKRIWLLLMSFILLISFNLHCVCADIEFSPQRIPTNMQTEQRFCNLEGWRNDPTPKFHDWFIDSYATCLIPLDQVGEKEINCTTCAVNDHYGSVDDQLYMTVSYISLSLELESGETLYVDKTDRGTAKYYVTAEISAASVDGLNQDDVIKTFESNHMFYNYYRPNHRIKFDHDKVWIHKIIFEPFHKGAVIGRR